MLEVLQRRLIPAVIAEGNVETRGLERGTVHGFRHDFVSQCVRAGWPESYICVQVGHESTDIIKRYIHLYPRERARRIGYIDFLGRQAEAAS